MDADILNNYSGGTQRNDLNKILQDTDNNTSVEIETIPNSSYLDKEQLSDFLRTYSSSFVILSLNAQSLNAKYDEILILVNSLQDKNLRFSAIALQETWFKDGQDISSFDIPQYELISQGRSCSAHGGLAIYLHCEYSYKPIFSQVTSVHWEGQAIEISSESLHRNIKLCNVYRPPRHNNNNKSIQDFLSEFAPVVSTLNCKSTDGIFLGDFNINLLEINEREEYNNFFELMVGNGYFPHISLPTRFSRRKCSLLDNIFIKSKRSFKNANSGIFFSPISDHLACLAAIPKLPERKKLPKFIKILHHREDQLQNFYNEIDNTELILNNDPLADPDANYELLHSCIQSALNTHLPPKIVKFSKYKHKRTAWITTEIMKSIFFRDTLHRKLKTYHPDSAEHLRTKTNLHNYKSLLKRNIRLAKMNHYAQEFDKYKHDIRKTWDTLKTILNKSCNKRELPHHFVINGIHCSDSKAIADNFNLYFTSIGHKLSMSSNIEVDESYKTYLRKVTEHSFKFKSVSRKDIAETIGHLTSKSMIFSYRKSISRDETPDIILDNTPVSRVSSFDFLGVVLDEHLTWGAHINKISSKILKVTGIMSRLKHFLPSTILKTMYDSMILPHLNYGITLWGFQSNRILRLQKRAVRVIHGAKYNAHTDPLFKKSTILKISDIFRLNCLKIFHKFLNEKVPAYINFMLQPVTHQYNTRNRRRPPTIRVHKSAAQKRIKIYLPRCLSNTHPMIKDKLYTHSIAGFTQYFKRYTAAAYNSVCTIPHCYICH